jgi:hypothetical protein
MPGVKTGSSLAFLHLVLFIWSTYMVCSSSSGQAVMGYFYIVVIDFFLLPFMVPVSFLSGLLGQSFLSGMIVLYGVVGTAVWFFIPYLAIKSWGVLSPRIKKQQPMVNS